MRNPIRRADPRHDPPTLHPEWCDRSRCGAGVNRLGEHRSEPIVARVDKRSGHVVGVRTQSADGSHWLELTMCLRLPAGTETMRAGYAHQLLQGITVAICRAWYRRHQPNPFHTTGARTR